MPTERPKEEPKRGGPPSGHVTAHPETGEEEEAKRVWVKGPARHAATALCVIVVVVSIALLMLRLGPKTYPDTTARLRVDGAAIPLYRALEGTERIHWLKPGGVVFMSDITKLHGPRYPVHVEVEKDLVVLGCVDQADLMGEDVDRVRRVQTDALAKR